MHTTIKKSKVGDYWNLQQGNFIAWYHTFQAAQDEAIKRYKRFYKEMAAYSMVLNIMPVQNLTLLECQFISKMYKVKCKGLSSYQYGYIKGIYERSTREW